METSLASLEQAGVSIYICANHLMRASVMAMRDVARKIRQDKSIFTVNSTISPLAEVFGLLDYEELKKAEERYVLNEG
ncbi:Phosphonopyruvate hydrolase [compost metagenome]